MTTRVLIVDDHPLVLRGLRITLDAEARFEVVALAESGEEALGLLDDARPDLALVDVSLPGMDGVELTRQLIARRPDLKVLAVSRHDDDLYAERLIRAGARGYLSKMEAAERVAEAARAVVAGRIVLREEIKDRLVLGTSMAHPGPLDILSDRELQVYESIGLGRTTREIADAMLLSVKTIETYQTRIKDKLGLESGRALVRHATRWAGQ